MLEANALTVKRGNQSLLDGVSVAVAPDELLVVLGENGAGKSTLLNVLCGDLAPQFGTVRLNGRALSSYRALELARLRALLPQEQQIAFGYTALEIVLLGRYPHCQGAPRRADVEIARAALARVDAQRLSERAVTTLSGGERARVQMARVLAQLADETTASSRYLLLDEPTADLDLAHQHLILEAARSVARDSAVGVIAVLHDFNLALQYADRVLCLQRGRSVACGTPDQVLTEELFAAAFGMRCALLAHPSTDTRVVVALGRVDQQR